MPTLVVGMLAVSLRSLGKHGTHQFRRYSAWQHWRDASATPRLRDRLDFDPGQLGVGFELGGDVAENERLVKTLHVARITAIVHGDFD